MVKAQTPKGSVDAASKRSDDRAKLLEQYGCGPVQLGGAELVYLRTELATGLPIVRDQPSLPDESSTWVDELVDRTASGIRDEALPARLNDSCGSCAFQAVCPAQDAGEQVVR